MYGISWCMQTVQICSKPNKARRAPVVVWFAAYLRSSLIHQEMVYTSHFLISSKSKPGSCVYLYHGVPIYKEGEATGALPGKLVRGAQVAPAA